MKRSRRCFFAVALALTAWSFLNVPARADRSVPGQVLVRVQSGASIAAVARDYGVGVFDGIPGTDLYCLTIARGADPAAFAQRLSRDSRVLYAEPNQVLAAPEVAGNPFHWGFDRSIRLDVTTLQVPFAQAGVNLSADGQVNSGSAAARVRGTGVLVAVIDTGVALNHPDLRGHLVDGYNALYPGQAPWDIADGLQNNIVGHGTGVAGVIARIAPGAQILPIRVLNGDGEGTLMNVAKGVEYAIQRGARVINMSWGASLRSRVLEDAVDRAERAGVVLVASAGNENSDRPQYPVTESYVIAVGAVEADDTKSAFSNYGSFVSVSAPGGGIRSTDWTGGYATWSGTSFAAPFVSAQAALLLSDNPTLRADKLRDRIRKSARSADAKNPKYRGKLGAGIINIEGSLTQRS